jgi:hypothetical protein
MLVFVTNSLLIVLLRLLLRQATLQLHILYKMQAQGGLSGIAIYSIASSIASAAFTMTDSSIMSERDGMVSAVITPLLPPIIP